MQLPSGGNPQEDGDVDIDVDMTEADDDTEAAQTAPSAFAEPTGSPGPPAMAVDVRQPRPQGQPPLARRGSVSCYKLGRPVADTLFGGVFYGQDTTNGKWIIVKRSRETLVQRGVNTSGHPVQEDLWSEIRVQKKLNTCEPACRHLGVLLDVCQDARFIYQIMEYYPNGDLYDYVLTWRHAQIPKPEPIPSDMDEKSNRDGAGPAALVYPISPIEVKTCKYFRQLLQGVYFMHNRRISHRDLSLENVMVDNENNMRIIDFGLAMEWPQGDPNSWICRPPPLGKMQYMSPECARCNHHRNVGPDRPQPTYDARANDIWCLGVMLFMMLIGEPPYSRDAAGTNARFQYCMRGRIPDLLKIWGLEHLASPAALDLLHAIFQPQDRRIRMEQIMCHPFLAQSRLDPGGKHGVG